MASDPIKILIVDDDEQVLIALERLLEGEGYSTVTAWGGREALALSEKARFDLLLVDEHVADLDFDALRRGLALRQPRRLPTSHAHSERATQVEWHDLQVGACRDESQNPLPSRPLTLFSEDVVLRQSPAHPNCTVSIEIDPPSTPSTGNVSGSSAALDPITYSN